jgi:phosphoenolpyruvate synthase/pyruvate phosphate dikinase
MDKLPDCVNLNEKLSTEVRVTGGKGSSLTILHRVKGVTVPYFFTVTT